MRFRIFLICFYSFIWGSCWAQERTPKKYALVIGVQKYKNLDTLKYSHIDAERFKAILESGLLGRFDSIISYTNEVANTHNINSFIAVRLFSLIQKLSDGDEIYFYFSGHGMPYKNQLDLALYDSYYKDTSNWALGNALGFRFIKDFLLEGTAKTNNANVFVFLDAYRRLRKKFQT